MRASAFDIGCSALGAFFLAVFLLIVAQRFSAGTIATFALSSPVRTKELFRPCGTNDFGFPTIPALKRWAIFEERIRSCLHSTLDVGRSPRRSPSKAESGSAFSFRLPL